MTFIKPTFYLLFLTSASKRGCSNGKPTAFSRVIDLKNASWKSVNMAKAPKSMISVREIIAAQKVDSEMFSGQV